MEEKIEKTLQNSIELKKSVKGDYSWNIKVYFDDDSNSTLDKLKEINNKLKETYENE